MCSHEDAASDEMCKTVSTQIQTLVNANLNDSGYNFFKRFVGICSEEDNQGLEHCQNFAKGMRYYFVSRKEGCYLLGFVYKGIKGTKTLCCSGIESSCDWKYI